MAAQKIIRVFSGIIILYLTQNINCKKENSNDYVTDIDGNSYGIVVIESKKWMKANLKTSQYNDGTLIPNITSSSDWLKLTTGAYCWYDNDINNKNPYGGLYNWFAINTGKLCPKGWHVPTHSEWLDLAYAVGGPEVAGGKLKATINWIQPNIGATNEFGFTAYPGGVRYVGDTYVSGEFYGIGSGGHWGSISEYSTNEFITIDLHSESGILFDDHCDKRRGVSIRCIKD